MPYGRVLNPPSWSSVRIVAGGPSAQRFNPASAGQVLAVNSAALSLSAVVPPDAMTVFSVDPRWIARHRDFLSQFTGEKYAATALETWPECDNIPGMTYLHRCADSGLSDSHGFVCTGGNSGYAAINLAVLKGAKEIHLYGYDMSTGEDKYRQWIPRFRTMLPQLRCKGVRVWNHNPNSAIDAFEKIGVHA